MHFRWFIGENLAHADSCGVFTKTRSEGLITCASHASGTLKLGVIASLGDDGDPQSKPQLLLVDTGHRLSVIHLLCSLL